jgi:phage regulator Rha-like protein
VDSLLRSWNNLCKRRVTPRPPTESLERHRGARRYNKAIGNRKGVSGESGQQPQRFKPHTHSCIDEFSESVTLELMSKSRAATQNGLIPLEVIERRIYFIRTRKVMLDGDLAELYGVRTKRLNEQVKRNIDRFPADFMFRLNQEESDRLRSQFATSKHGRGGRRYQPYVFTEHGALMLASVLNSEKAIQASIQIVRAFVRLRELLATHQELARKLAEMEKKYNAEFKAIFEVIQQLTEPPEEPERKPIGFTP